MAATATAVAASLSVAGGLGRPLARVSSPAAPMRTASPVAARRAVVVRASAAEPVMREKASAAAAAAGIAAVAAVAAALAVPEVAEAAPALSPSLKNFLLSIASGGVVLVAIVGAVVAVSNFDPVKRT
uniref:Photosystem II reaction center X protein n=1 Tax=Oryza meridionalis TaxID=40149 RepID=A0A0E0D0B4_9ORYZ